jgi:hypothetical protein
MTRKSVALNNSRSLFALANGCRFDTLEPSGWPGVGGLVILAALIVLVDLIAGLANF